MRSRYKHPLDEKLKQRLIEFFPDSKIVQSNSCELTFYVTNTKDDVKTSIEFTYCADENDFSETDYWDCKVSRGSRHSESYVFVWEIGDTLAECWDKVLKTLKKKQLELMQKSENYRIALCEIWDRRL